MPPFPPPDPRSDADLLAGIARGDESAFETLYRRHRDWVFRLARRFCRADEDAADVTQETFAYLLRHAPRLRLAARLTTLLYPVVKNTALARIRKDRRLRFADPPALPDRPAPDPPAGVAPLDPELDAALAALPEGQREVLLMRVIDEMSLQEIALALGIPVGTAKSRLHNALAALRADERTRRHFL